MIQDLFKLKEYGIFTFKSTSQALKAERTLKEASAHFLLMPTPREISASCGLAVKLALKDLTHYQDILVNNRVEIESIYQVSYIKGEKKTERLDHA